jgi:hypothetical protein
MMFVEFRIMEMIDDRFKVVELHRKNGLYVDYVEDISECFENDDVTSLVRKVRAVEQATQLSVVREIDVIKDMEEYLKINVDTDLE